MANGRLLPIGGPEAVAGSIEDTFPCPSCGAQVTSYRALPKWCPACDWNLQTVSALNVPGQTGETLRPTDRLARERAEGLRAAILADPSVLERLPPARDALAIAAITNSFSIASFLTGMALIVLFGGFIGILFGLFLVAGGLRTFVHLRRLPSGHQRLTRSSLPETFALLDEICAELAVNPPKTIELTKEHRIEGEYRLRGSSLHVGVPLVRHLSGDELCASLTQAIAALGFRSGPVSWFVENARRSLRQLSEFLNEPTEIHAPDLLTSPVTLSGSLNGSQVRMTIFAELLINVVRLIVRRPAEWLVSSFNARSYRRNHVMAYRADAIAARFTSPPAVVGALSAEVLETSVRFAVQRRFLTPGLGAKIETPAQLWAEIEAHARQLPGTEQLRLLRKSSLTGNSGDPELPPPGYRADILNVYRTPEPLGSGHTLSVSSDRYQTIWSEIEVQSDRIADEFAGLFDRSLALRRSAAQ
jgi:hypothetical protein